MDYKVVKAAVDKTKSEIQKLESNLSRDSLALNNLKRDLAQLDILKSEELAKDKSVQLKSLQDKETETLRKEISQLEEGRLKAQQRKQIDLENIKYEDYKQSYAGELDLINNLMNSVSNIEDNGKKFLGDRLYKAIYDNLNQTGSKLVTDDLEVIIDRVSRLESKLYKVDVAKYLDWGEYIEKIFGKINPERFEQSNAIVIYTIVMIVVFFVASKTLFPILLFLFTTLSGLNLMKSKNTLQCMRIAKAISDNRQSIMDSIDTAIEEHMQNDRIAYEKDYQDIDNELLDRINSKQEEINAISAKVADEFVYNANYLNQRYENKKTNINSQITSLVSDISKQKENITNMKIKLSELNEQLKESMKNIIQCYTSPEYKKDSFLFDSEFLFDIKNEEPVMFNHPMNSSLFFYNDLTVCNNFIKLMLMQSMVRMNLRCYKPYILDTIYMGSTFTIFNNDKWNGYLDISNTQEQVKVVLEELNIRLQKRLQTFCGLDITKFNEEKIATESVPESYIWLFVIAPEANLLSSKELNQLMVVGHQYGIYVNIFIPSESFEEEPKKFAPLLNSVSSCFALSQDRIVTQQKAKLKKLCG